MCNSSLRATVFALAAVCLSAAPAALAAQASTAPGPTGATTFDSVRFGGLHWRSIGPYRGGRVTTVVGVPSEPLTYYMGATGGGIWKTDDAGLTWRNVSDHYIRRGSIGSLAVAPSDPNVVYAGMGEREPRGQSSTWGDGVYRSTDAGRTWKYTGLDATRSIAQLRVDPTNPDVVYAAAEGSRWTFGPDRGIYKSTDGGARWTLLLHPSDSVSAPEACLANRSARLVSSGPNAPGRRATTRSSPPGTA